MQPFAPCPCLRMRRALFPMVMLLFLSVYSLGQVTYRITDPRDDQDYQVVHIDDLWWMGENLNIGIRVDLAMQQTNNNKIEKYCPLNDDYNCDIYGGLYQWNELMNYTSVESFQGLCPSGWHVSTNDEWRKLEAFLGMNQADIDAIGVSRGTIEGGMLKSTGTQYWLSPNSSASNSVGFSALPSGYRDNQGNFVFLKNRTYFWHADTYNGNPWYRGLFYSSGQIYLDYSDPKFGCPARCVKESPYMFLRDSITDARDSTQYTTVLIANHWWMAENLNIGERIDHNLTQRDNDSIQKYCYNDEEAYCDTFGGLYIWDEAMGYDPDDKKGICPEGWHLPTDEDWKELEWALLFEEDDLDKTEGRGNKGIFLQPEGGSGFDALLGGHTFPPNNTFSKLYTDGLYWTSTEGLNSQVAWSRLIQKDESAIERNENYYRQNAMSVRCVCNADEIVSFSIVAEDTTMCPEQEITLRAKSCGGTGSKEFRWWSDPEGFSSSDSIVIVTPEIPTTYYVRVSDGYVYIRDSVLVDVLPSPEFYFRGDINVCAEEELEYSVYDYHEPSYDYSSWDISEDGFGTIISTNGDTAVIKWGNTPGYGYISVTATDVETGCSAQKKLVIEVLSSPKPEIVLKGTSLLICTDPEMEYQWYHNEESIKDADLQFYYAKNNEVGSYAVEITWENKCQNFSDPINFTEKSTDDPVENELRTVFIHPNPADGNFTVEMISDYTGEVGILVINNAGWVVKHYRFNKYNAIYSTRLELGELAEGSYLMAVEYGTEREVLWITIKK